MNNSIRDIIRGVIAGETDRRLIVNTDSFFVRLFRRGPKTKRRRRVLGNFILLSSIVIASVMMIISSFVFFISDVLLFRPQVRINRYGAFVPTNSCGREYVLFMFNSSDLWARTGIQLRKGDRLKISASGGFNSTVSQAVKAANDNFKPRYPWYDSQIRLEFEKDAASETDDIANCMYTARGAYFGSILYQIQPEVAECAYADPIGGKPIHQLVTDDGRHFCKVLENGMLRLAVNDIYLTDPIIEQFETHNRALAARLLKTELPATDADIAVPNDSTTRALIRCDSLRLYTLDLHGSGRFHIAGPKFRAYFREHRDAWFHDNIGEILINIEIQRKLTARQFMLHGIVDWYRRVEESADAIRGHGFWAGCGQVAKSAWIFLGLLKTKAVLIVWGILFVYALIVFREWFGRQLKSGWQSVKRFFRTGRFRSFPKKRNGSRHTDR